MILRTAEEDYLKLIYKLHLSYNYVSLRMVSSELGVSAPAVTKMVRKLQDKSLVNFCRKDGVSLTPIGEEAALGVIRGHRLIEMFLHDYLGYSWDEVHEEAEELEHAVSVKFKDRLARFLDYPSHDPHGKPIPATDPQTVK